MSRLYEEIKPQYLELKNKGLTDPEIANALFISLITLKRYKKREGIKGIKRPQTNKQGITEEQLKQAEANGIPRANVLKRTGALGWDVEKAINDKIIPRAKRRTRGE